VASFAVILPAAGKSSRFGDQFYKKPFVPLENRPVWMHAAEKFCNRSDVRQTLLVISPEDMEEFQSKFSGNAALMGVQVVQGGADRSDSVAAGLAQIAEDIEYVAVHDAARPCLIGPWIDAVFAEAKKTSAAMLAAPVTATLKRVGPNRTVEATVSRDGLWEAQTPQVFRRELLVEAYARRGTEPATDDAQLVERLGKPVSIVPCSAMNLKITTKDDLRLATAILRALPKPKIFGPAHPFADDDQWR
jgi:2-C-methyl-D-erythritol 4-phosphate cytidylyltransferase